MKTTGPAKPGAGTEERGLVRAGRTDWTEAGAVLLSESSLPGSWMRTLQMLWMMVVMRRMMVMKNEKRREGRGRWTNLVPWVLNKWTWE
jgi:hypothetical protein